VLLALDDQFRLECELLHVLLVLVVHCGLVISLL
jgi:hypothetical protein